MGSVLLFPRLRCGTNGAVHIWRTPDGKFEIGHESRSGDSWGWFETFAFAAEAVEAAHRLNREKLGIRDDGRV